MADDQHLYSLGILCHIGHDIKIFTCTLLVYSQQFVLFQFCFSFRKIITICSWILQFCAFSWLQKLIQINWLFWLILGSLSINISFCCTPTFDVSWHISANSGLTGLNQLKLRWQQPVLASFFNCMLVCIFVKKGYRNLRSISQFILKNYVYLIKIWLVFLIS